MWSFYEHAGGRVVEPRGVHRPRYALPPAALCCAGFLHRPRSPSVQQLFRSTSSPRECTGWLIGLTQTSLDLAGCPARLPRVAPTMQLRGGGTDTIEPGDWMCSSCQKSNFRLLLAAVSIVRTHAYAQTCAHMRIPETCIKRPQNLLTHAARWMVHITHTHGRTPGCTPGLSLSLSLSPSLYLSPPPSLSLSLSLARSLSQPSTLPTHTHTPGRRRDRCFFCETPKRVSDDRAARGKYCMYEGASMAIAGQTVAPPSDLRDEIERRTYSKVLSMVSFI